MFSLTVSGGLWNGNLKSASSESGNDDNGSMIGVDLPPSGIAWGAKEYLKCKIPIICHFEYEYVYCVCQWILGTQKGIETYANVNHIPINNCCNNEFIRMVTCPQKCIAVLAHTVYKIPIIPIPA